MAIHKSDKLERCIRKVKAKGSGNPYAICHKSVGKKTKAKSKSKK